MHPSIKRLNQCLVYTTWTNDAVREAFDNLIEALGDDLEELYDSGEEVDEAMEKVSDALMVAENPEQEDDEEVEDESTSG